MAASSNDVSSPPIALADVSKSFGAVEALRGVTLDLAAGEAHALMGENGAGKSTLVKLLAGVHSPDTGTLLVDGQPTRFTGPADARAAGVAVIYQEPTLFPDLTVAENIFMGRHPTRSGRRVDRKEMRRRSEALFARLGVRLDPDRPARGLSIADQQLVEIAKALSFDARVLVMDEPTAALSGVEVDRLFAVVRTLRAGGTSVLFVSHRLDEVFSLCQRITVLRDGGWVCTEPAADVTAADVVRRMVGRDVSSLYPKQDAPSGEVLLDVRGLGRRGVFADVTFQVRAGEIVALAGLVGAGRSEVVRAVFGVDGHDEGTVAVAGRNLPAGRPAAAMSAGLALVPEDRRQQGLVMELSIERNATLPRRWALAHAGLLRRSRERRDARRWTERLQVTGGRLGDPVATLSGGNQQKVVLAKWLATAPKVLIVDEPTRGIDIGTKAQVHRLLSELAGAGVGILMVSSELPEVLAMADRVLVMREGRIVGELGHAEADEESVMFAATGQGAGSGRPAIDGNGPAA